jgi:hypothetical protein
MIIVDFFKANFFLNGLTFVLLIITNGHFRCGVKLILTIFVLICERVSFMSVQVGKNVKISELRCNELSLRLEFDASNFRWLHVLPILKRSGFM